MAQSDFKFKIFTTEEKFPSCSKMLEVCEKPIKFKIASFDRVNADQSFDLQKLRDLRIKVREGGSSTEIIKNFNTQMRSLLINNEKGGMQNFFDALYTPNYVKKIKEGDMNKMLRLHDTF
jgi:hypothetical protein